MRARSLLLIASSRVSFAAEQFGERDTALTDEHWQPDSNRCDEKDRAHQQPALEPTELFRTCSPAAGRANVRIREDSAIPGLGDISGKTAIGVFACGATKGRWELSLADAVTTSLYVAACSGSGAVP
jgi:hypothetical protein